MYARWIPVHIRDMQSLPVSDEFKKFWVLQKTHNLFSCMPLDQAHEQNNKLVKDSGGAVGLTENPTAFRRWMVGGPEQARLLKEFERQLPCSTAEEATLTIMSNLLQCKNCLRSMCLICMLQCQIWGILSWINAQNCWYWILEIALVNKLWRQLKL